MRWGMIRLFIQAVTTVLGRPLNAAQPVVIVERLRDVEPLRELRAGAKGRRT